MKKFLLTMCLVSLSVFTFAQSMEVSGKVTSADDGIGLPGVSVTIQGTTRGTTSDVEGMYKLTAQKGATLVYSFVGMNSQSIVVGNQSTVNVSLSSDANQLSEVVVTALGVSREKKSLGYAVQEVGGDAVSTVKQQNFVSSLSGKVAGVQIRQNTSMGGSVNVLIRGNNSLASNNQPLYVVDGVPVSNYQGNTSAQGNGQTGFDYGNATSDINPEDVESISVLKGAAATALYGSRGANGVIMVTTKKGVARKGVGVSISSTLTTGSIDKSTFMNYQDKYGAGYSNYYYGNADGSFDAGDINGDGTLDDVVPTYEDASYGQKFDPNRMVYQWESFVPESENFGKAMPWVAAQNTPANYYFQQQTTLNNSISFNGGNENGTFRLGYTNLDNKDILPNSTQKRHNVNLNSTYKFGERITATTSVNYSRQATIGRFGTGYSGLNPMQSMRQWWQTNVDMERQEYFYNLTGRNVTWNQKDPIGGDTGPIYTDNAYWTRYENYQSDNRNRLFGNVNLNYKVTDWFNITGRVATDTYSELREERLAEGSNPIAFGINGSDETSGYQRVDINFTEMNYDIMGNFNHRFNDDFSLSGIIGTNIRTESRERIMLSTAGGLASPGIWSIGNSVNTPPLPQESLLEKQVNGYYASASLGYKDTYFLDISDRYDISSALPAGSNAYNYYAASGSFVFSNLIDANWLRFGKLRFGYAEVGNDTGALNVYDTYSRFDNFGSSIITSLPSTKNNAFLKPERTKSLEAGLELNTLGGRLGLDMSVYQVNTIDQILNVSQSTSTGYSSRYVNAGELSNKGIEIALTGTPIKVAGFSWDMNLNFAKNMNTVESLYGDVENIVLGSYQGGITVNATKGEQYGTIRGTGYAYDDNGNKLVDASGYYVAQADQVLGVAAPDFTAGLYNTLTYKGLSLGFLIDMSQGGEVFSLDTYYGFGTGLPDFTAGLNELGNEMRLPLDEGGGVLNEGVQADGSVNTVRARADYYGGNYYWGNSSRNPAEIHVYDASYVKLREASLSYSLPTKLYSNFANKISVGVVGRNLWIIKKHVPFADPESGLGSGNAQGYLTGSYPTVRSMGFNVKLDF
ncbi:SusC/RagA family TonB-linked outer membrane protein [Arcticibacterium luteifluviistationis]|uniref:SusC/RagA family TonB-linked outer membrane protein n=1 Tax=Arcticibacterium luteifluviistationis TaxID=1784714 RepID=A0A2Z4GE89_9BACT|nr:SusC/RagA family TonB-linked outer membrane protein [Arcticibacterium luteifluviistationis]AWV99437.1 SusC/RagA family TonB-linked outer membrane protein [Arcticibacterium luteifluviistationis]